MWRSVLLPDEHTREPETRVLAADIHLSDSLAVHKQERQP